LVVNSTVGSYVCIVIDSPLEPCINGFMFFIKPPCPGIVCIMSGGSLSFTLGAILAVGIRDYTGRKI